MPRPVEKDYRRLGFGVAEANRAPQDHEPIHHLLAQITSAAPLATYRWQYEWREAIINGTAPTSKAGGLTGTAFSVSELSNATMVAYGATIANIPAGFAPVQIPVNTYVIIFPHRRQDGSLVWLIANTQAIDGICP